MTKLEETAFAKVNLALHVRRRRADAHHEIDSFFTFADDGDRLTAEAANELSLMISGEFAAGLSTGDDNLVSRTVRLIQQRFGIETGVKLHLIKNLPVAAGIGGGSADAAAVARLLVRLWQIETNEHEMADLLAPLGADIPACIGSRTILGQGTGAELREIDGAGMRAMPILLVNPRVPLATGSVFDGWDGVDRGALPQGDLWSAVLAGRNDLEAPAKELCPPISNVLDALVAANPVLARMSGSGATCFALYESVEQRDDAQRHIQIKQPYWWTMASRLR